MPSSERNFPATISFDYILVNFRPAFDRSLYSPDYVPAFDLDAALSQARRMTARDDAGAHLGDNRDALAEERAHTQGASTPSPVKPAPTKDLQP
mgnify:CR=1 FL=1